MTAPALLSRRDLILRLLERLDACGVRYVVLHSYESLPDDLPSDLDLAVHPADAGRLETVLAALRERGYIAAQCLNYAVHGYYFVFLWPEAGGMSSLAIDFTLYHREGGLILMPAAELVAGRRRLGMCWIPEPRTEFGYLLGKKTLKADLPAPQAARLRDLAAELGRDAAEDVAARWFGNAWKKAVVDACLSGAMSAAIGDMRPRFWRNMLRRDPLNPLRHCLTEIPRRWKRWWRPAGISVAVLGPDGAGKSTLVSDLVRQMQPAFRSTRVFHGRPFVLAGRRRTSIANSHEMPPDPASDSVLRLAIHLLDYCFGHLLHVRPAKARAGLIVFDRYFQDMLADPMRYRYGGPLGLVRLAARLVPQPDLALILDAPEDVILTRKQERKLDEVRRQRRIYLRLARAFPRAEVLDAAAPPADVARAACTAVTRFMASRLERNAPGWSEPGSGGLVERCFAQLCDGSRAEAPAAVARTHSFGILPSRRNPRLLLPLDNARSMRQGLEIYTPYQLRARILTWSLARLIAAGTGIWRDRLSLPAGSLASLESLAEEITGERRPVFALSLAGAERSGKLVIQVMRPHGAILGYIKFPLTAPAAERVRHETATLDELRRFTPLRPYLPAVLFGGEWRGRPILFQSPVEGQPGPARFSPLHSRFLETLRRASAIQRSGDGLVQEIAARWEEAAAGLDSAWRDLGRQAMRLAARELRGAEISCGVWHGDFAPWNTRVRDGRLLVFDWESAEWDMPVCWDMFHFDLQVASLLRRKSGIDLARLEAPAWHGVYLLYLLRSVSRCREDNSGEDALAWRRQKLLCLLTAQPQLRALEAIHAGSRY